MSPIADTNDPLDFPRPGSAGSKVGSGSDPLAEFQRWQAIIDEVHQAIGHARVACFSSDDDDGAPADPRLGIGSSSSAWARDRMWGILPPGP